jgi:hypothetical protein
MSRSTAHFMIPIATIAAALWTSGCNEPIGGGGMGDAGYARQTFRTASRAEVFQAAQAAFRQYFSIADADPATGTITSRPQEVDARGEPTQVRELLGGQSRRRQIGELRVLTRGPEVIALCRVQRQRLDTTERRAFQTQRGDDRPTENTPFEAEAGATGEQRTAWTNIGRNRSLEADILRSLRMRIEPEEATTEPAAMTAP